MGGRYSGGPSIITRTVEIEKKVKVPCNRPHLDHVVGEDRGYSVKSAYRILRRHPNFNFPKPPKNDSPEEVAKFVIETLARFVSPDKMPEENDEFECIDIATAIREKLGPEIITLLRHGISKVKKTRVIDMDDEII